MLKWTGKLVSLAGAYIQYSDKITPKSEAIVATIQSAVDKGEIVVRLIQGCPAKKPISQLELTSVKYTAKIVHGIDPTV